MEFLAVRTNQTSMNSVLTSNNTYKNKHNLNKSFSRWKKQKKVEHAPVSHVLIVKAAFNLNAAIVLRWMYNESDGERAEGEWMHKEE